MTIKMEKRVSSGRYIDLANLSHEDIDIQDISTSLNQIVRFTGHYKDRPPLTVAQHTLLCVKVCEKLFPNEKKIKRAVIIHDFPEAYYGDVITQIKRGLGDSFENLVRPIDEIVLNKYWPYPDIGFDSEEIKRPVKICDYISLDIERRSMWESQYGKDKWPTIPTFDMTVNMKQNLFDVVQKQEYVDLEKLLNG